MDSEFGCSILGPPLQLNNLKVGQLSRANCYGLPKFWSNCKCYFFRFINYQPTSLERTYRHELLTEHDLGISVDLILPDAYTHVSSIYRKDTEPLYHSFMYSVVSLLSGIYPLPAMHSLLVTLYSNYLPRCTYHLRLLLQTLLTVSRYSTLIIVWLSRYSCKLSLIKMVRA